MTREKAIEVIKRRQKCPECVTYHNCDACDRDFDKALEMAIEALKAEPCEDAVSREAVIVGKRVPITEEREDLINEVIKHLPSVTPNQRWIPVNYDRYPETYPKAFQEVWITDAYGEVRHEAYGGARNIKAWMPYVIPTPYMEERTNEKNN